MGFMGSGFYVLSVDERSMVRTMLDRYYGTLLQVNGKDNLEESGCVYNEAYITLDAQILGPGEFNKLRFGLIQ
ncbi:hypothetical protein D3C75_975650 [compost metagenome]